MQHDLAVETAGLYRGGLDRLKAQLRGDVAPADELEALARRWPLNQERVAQY